MENKEKGVLDIEGIKKIIPHRYPFLLVDRVTEIIEPDFIKGYKNVSVNEAFFQGHFPAHPVMPGVLILEALAQLGAILILRKFPEEKRMAYFAGMDGVKFKNMVVPGDRLDLEVKVMRDRGTYAVTHGQAFVDGKLATEATLKCILAK